MVAVHNFFFFYDHVHSVRHGLSSSSSFSLSESSFYDFVSVNVSRRRECISFNIDPACCFGNSVGKHTTRRTEEGRHNIHCIRLQRFDLFGYKQRWFHTGTLFVKFFFLFHGSNVDITVRRLP